MVRVCYLLVLILLATHSFSQELFPMTEPASNVPRGVWGVRFFDESYNEVGYRRDLAGLKVMYGLTPRLTLIATGTVSNHHNKTLPPEFPDHNTPQIGVHHPYRFNGIDLYAKYRFLSMDGEHSHFRVALYGECSELKVAHDEAEPTLLDDNSGVGGGLIATLLYHHFAASFTGGFIHPFIYKGTVPDELAGLPGLPATITYGNGYNGSFSLGYLLHPAEYTSYRQMNWNIYCEFLGKQYDAMMMQVGNVYYNIPQYTLYTRSNKALQAAKYLEVYPGVQAIVRSNTRLDLSVGLPVVGRSYVHYYPVFALAAQRYIYGKRHRSHVAS